jgi:site-specific DNA recombinase
MARRSDSRPAANGSSGAAEKKVIRCAIYARKSTEEGLQQEFNSLDAQREAAEAIIVSQKNEGWQLVADRFDDGGYTGGNMDRPALKRLLAAVESQSVDCVVVYKVDRLSRSLMDFARIIEVFDQNGVSFVSVTQQFNTTTSIGRLTLNITDHRFYGKIYGAAAEDDPADPATWYKANPSLVQINEKGEVTDGFITEDMIRKEYETAESEGDLTSFKRYFLNVWDQKENRALDIAKWDASAGDWKTRGLMPIMPEDTVRTLPHDFMARFFQRRCWAGVDLSMTTDLTSVVFLFPGDDDSYDVLPSSGYQRRAFASSN